MLRSIKARVKKNNGGRFTIVASKYNAIYVDAMLAAAREVLKRARVKSIQVIRVPGAFEIPVVAARLARAAGAQVQESVCAIICLGVILRGETTHAAHIGEAVSRALMDIQIRQEIPVIHEVLLLENEEQARVRCLDRKHNRGAEAAQTALAMARVMNSISKNQE